MSEDTPTPTVEEPLVQPLSDSDPEVISDRYVILKCLGEGGMGKVYLAEDNVIKRNIAVKILRFDDSQGLVSRFHQEAKALAKLNHPGIVTAFDFGLIEGKDPYLVMDYKEGITLDQLLSRKGTLRLTDFRRIFSQITRSMQYAHDQGIVHRDLKPSNIIVRRSKGKTEAFILDFGISKILQEDDSQFQTKTGQIVGSPKYVSPEQIQSGPIDARSDIYALGCVMYESLTGSPPFAGDSVMETLRMHSEDEPSSLSERSGKTYSDKLELLIASTLKKNKEDRIQSMDLLYKALQEYENEQVEEVLESDEGQSKKSVFVLVGFAGLAVVLASFLLNPSSNLDSTDSAEKESRVDRRESKRKVAEKIEWKETQIENTKGIFAPNRAPTVEELITLKSMHGSRFVGLNLDGLEVEKALIVWIKDNGIKYLFLRNSILSEDCYNYIEKLNSVTALYFGGNTTIGGSRFEDRHLKQLVKLPLLVRLSLKDSKISDSGAKLFKSFPSLNYLDLTGNVVSDKGVKFIGESNTLKTINISGMSGITGASVDFLRRSKIVNLYMYNTALESNDLKVFKLLPQLQYLGIGNPGQVLTAAQLKPLTKLNLRVLKFSHTIFSKNDVLVLSNCKKLRELHFRSCTGVDDNHVSALTKQLPKCRIFILKPFQMSGWMESFD